MGKTRQQLLTKALMVRAFETDSWLEWYVWTEISMYTQPFNTLSRMLSNSEYIPKWFYSKNPYAV